VRSHRAQLALHDDADGMCVANARRSSDVRFTLENLRDKWLAGFDSNLPKFCQRSASRHPHLITLPAAIWAWLADFAALSVVASYANTED